VEVMDIKTGKDLFVLVREGEMSAFTTFYTQFFQKLLLASEKYVKDVFVAEEIVQDVFLKIWENPENLTEIHAIKPYLYRSVINASINHVNRQRNIELHHLKIAAESNDEALLSLDEENELIVLLHTEIGKLPPQCQKVFKMNRFEHLKYREIAEILNLSERTVENHIANALKLLRAALLNKNPDGKSSNRNDLLMSLFLY
jgi:RNA polymerase sigma-70 factor (ECF subfamily)